MSKLSLLNPPEDVAYDISTFYPRTYMTSGKDMTEYQKERLFTRLNGEIYKTAKRNKIAKLNDIKGVARSYLKLYDLDLTPDLEKVLMLENIRELVCIEYGLKGE